MVVRCADCKLYLDDEFRTTVCPHGTFPANDGQNRFRHHPESHLSLWKTEHQVQSLTTLRERVRRYMDADENEYALDIMQDLLTALKHAQDGLDA